MGEIAKRIIGRFWSIISSSLVHEWTSYSLKPRPSTQLFFHSCGKNRGLGSRLWTSYVQVVHLASPLFTMVFYVCVLNSELEESLLVMPFSDVTDFLKLLDVWIQVCVHCTAKSCFDY